MCGLEFQLGSCWLLLHRWTRYFMLFRKRIVQQFDKSVAQQDPTFTYTINFGGSRDISWWRLLIGCCISWISRFGLLFIRFLLLSSGCRLMRTTMLVLTAERSFPTTVLLYAGDWFLIRFPKEWTEFRLEKQISWRNRIVSWFWLDDQKYNNVLKNPLYNQL